MLDFRISKLLSTVFTPELNITNSLKFANSAIDIIGTRLDGDQSILPIPEEAPLDIPRIQLYSSDKSLELNISPKRTNLFYYSPFDLDAETINLEEFCSISSEFFCKFQKKLELMVQRLAVVTERVLPNENAPDYIRDKYCKEEYKKKGTAFSNVKGFEIHSLKKYPWEGFQLNSWVRIRSTQYNPQEPIPAILVINDLNTLSQEEDPDKVFSHNDVYNYFEKIPHHLNGILNKYFSEDGDINE